MKVSFAELEISGDFEAGPWRERGLIRLFLGFFVIASSLWQLYPQACHWTKLNLP